MDELARELDVLTSSQKMETVSIHLSQGCKGVWTPSHSLHCCHRGANILVNVIIPAPPPAAPRNFMAHPRSPCCQPALQLAWMACLVG